ncbi:hypothetical protein RRG08_031759 [Elysia crispata]|uniref:Uncharacterized protein n=1 Tax=Elysia crispata TaxID=231223 RepID=A0AAE1DF54_9GAST|nr:hypothetical protein RRG08_031759 [Elysia crispata]
MRSSFRNPSAIRGGLKLGKQRNNFVNDVALSHEDNQVFELVSVKGNVLVDASRRSVSVAAGHRQTNWTSVKLESGWT